MDFLKIFCAFSAGAAVGAAACYYAVKNRERDRADEEIAAVKEYYIEKSKKQGEKIEEVKAQGEKLKNATDYIKERLNYETFSDVAEYEGEDVVINDHPREVLDIYEITLEQYVNSELTYEKKDLKFYVEDGTLCDDTGEPIDIDHSIGYDILASFEDSLVDTVYVRNDKTETDYEVEKEEGGYSSLIGEV